MTNAVMCESVRLACEATPEPNDILYWVFSGIRAADGSVSYGTGPVGEVCYSPEEAAAAEAAQVELPEFTLADFQRLPLPAGEPSIQPGNGYTLINVETNVMVSADPTTFDTELVGFPVQVRATPARYTWSFGDGASLGPTDDPGAPWPDLRTTHSYESAGAYGITVTTHWTGEYSVAGGPWLPVAGEAEVTSDPVSVEALAGRNVLVGDTLDD